MNPKEKLYDVEAVTQYVTWAATDIATWAVMRTVMEDVKRVVTYSDTLNTVEAFLRRVCS